MAGTAGNGWLEATRYLAGCSIITCAQYLPLDMTYGIVARESAGTSDMSGNPISRAVRNGKWMDCQQRICALMAFVAGS
jgi:hypothetical protein